MHKMMSLCIVLATTICGASEVSAVPSKYTQSVNRLSTRGLYDVHSAESMGEGRLTFNLSSSWYGQESEKNYSPNTGTDIFTGTFSFSFGINPYFDLFTAISGFTMHDYKRSGEKSGLGTILGGIQARLPLAAESPVFLGARLNIIGGSSASQINTNRSDGYNYFETRDGYDFSGMLMQSFCIGKDGKGVKFHLNEGGVMTLQDTKDNLILLGLGMEINPHPILTIGVEANSRTSMSDANFATDPLWITPVIQFHTPVNCNFQLGSNISLSRERDDKKQTTALEPFRIFAGLGFSFDLLASRRNAISEKEKQEEYNREVERKQRESAEQKNVELQAKADSLTLKAYNDSLMLVKVREMEKLRADSLSAKAKIDSIQLADTKKKLEEEKSKRSDAEKQLLSTGLLLLDAVYFESGKAEVSMNSESYLSIIGKMLLKYPKLLIEVSGHTDNIGNITSNMNLSKARAEAVRFFLIKISPELINRVTSQGYGPSHPKASNTSAAGRKVNRRVELQVLNKDALSEYNK
jgi:outer membrane protein OmpA-like peptidoglycan-associated protein